MTETLRHLVSDLHTDQWDGANRILGAHYNLILSTRIYPV